MWGEVTAVAAPGRGGSGEDPQLNQRAHHPIGHLIAEAGAGLDISDRETRVSYREVDHGMRRVGPQPRLPYQGVQLLLDCDQRLDLGERGRGGGSQSFG